MDLDVLRNAPLFTHLDDEVFSALTAELTEVELSRGASVFTKVMMEISCTSSYRARSNWAASQMRVMQTCSQSWKQEKSFVKCNFKTRLLAQRPPPMSLHQVRPGCDTEPSAKSSSCHQKSRYSYLGS